MCVCAKVVCDKVVCDKVVCDKAVCDKVVCDKLYVTKEEDAEAEPPGRGGGTARGVQIQKQEPHNFLWGQKSKTKKIENNTKNIVSQKHQMYI